jgi:hypothetical protein
LFLIVQAKKKIYAADELTLLECLILKIIDSGWGIKATDARKINGIVILLRVSVA